MEELRNGGMVGDEKKNGGMVGDDFFFFPFFHQNLGENGRTEKWGRVGHGLIEDRVIFKYGHRLLDCCKSELAVGGSCSRGILR